MVLSLLSRRAVIASASALGLALTGTAATAVALSHKDVTVEVDGVSQPVSGFFRTVGDALDAGGVSVGAHDLVAPAVAESLADGQTVVVRTAVEYRVEVDGRDVSAWSTAGSADEVLDGIAGGSVVMAADRSTVREALAVSSRGGPVRVDADGQSSEVVVAAGDGVEEILAKAGVEASPLDRVEFVSEGEDLAVRVQRVTRGAVTSTEAIPHGVEEREDAEALEGVRAVVQEGADGSVTTTSYRETVDGEAVVDVVVSTQRVEPVARVVSVGTKKAAAAAGAAGYPATAVGGSDLDAMFARIAQCESGGNPTTNTGNGYYGMYQFSLPTWQSVGGTGLPSEASAEEQLARAKMLQARSGWGQWGCSPY
ncbi:transglycosylase family protein [Actinomyces sp. B33]|uniref:resuscitation-promoting factor n=1 Tax=Actinomyces sp. B33 TaxID=2942131 RepID=UPI0023424CDC|nr:resuscitation-promoting factor [Actinomyces sp. B33]MDC4233755.1 transglycosylase family protein [Actinomyces sp. B33]